MSKYNKCEGCKLYNGRHCTGAKSYEPNANEHRIICNEHMAKQFWVVYQQLHRSEIRVKELVEKIDIAEEALNNAYRFDCDICKNLKFKCDDKCDDKVDKIVEQALQKMKEVSNDNSMQT